MHTILKQTAKFVPWNMEKGVVCISLINNDYPGGSYGIHHYPTHKF
jgi:hypothetical protein